MNDQYIYFDRKSLLNKMRRAFYLLFYFFLDFFLDLYLIH